LLASGADSTCPTPTRGEGLPRPYYEDDACTIYHGDCREVLAALPLDAADMVLTDPPYGMNRFATDGKDFLKVVGPALQTAFTRLRSPGSMFVFTSTAEVVNVANAVAQPLKRLLWMYKPNDCTYPLGGWLLTSEAILWFHKGERLGLEERRPFKHDCYTVTSVGQEGVTGHPTVKPISVVSDFVSRVAPGAVVLDPFLGSGTTLLAAKRLGRRAIGVEIEEKYCYLAAERLASERSLLDGLVKPTAAQEPLALGV
jgi:site-specific DNA-methyltransferase (adenine-specific)